MARKKKITAESIVEAVADDPTLLERALTHYGVLIDDVFVVREVSPGVLRIITVDARKFTYPPQG